MNENNEFALVPKPPGALEKSEPAAKRILSGMVADTLALGKEAFSPVAKSFRIGEYEWCEPDYRQLMTWAGAANFKPEDVVAVLFNKQSNLTDEDGKQMR